MASVKADAPFGTGESRGGILLGTTLAFGITTICIVFLRIGFRLHRRTITCSDWFIAIALVCHSYAYSSIMMTFRSCRRMKMVMIRVPNAAVGFTDCPRWI
jgi:hypothetical protein